MSVLIRKLGLIVLLGTLIFGVIWHCYRDNRDFARAERELLRLNPDNLDMQEFANAVGLPLGRMIEDGRMRKHVRSVALGRDGDAAAMACVLMWTAHVHTYVRDSDMFSEEDAEDARRSRTEVVALAGKVLQLDLASEARRWLVVVTNEAISGPRRGP